ncbi:TadE family protein [Stutzerimonas xanthomarina]|uniref:TadE/TadG family type IV pilus assembly protein n=1 Tax=Stutzerimonas xanthomarina TaxID=271420 RepID=UPI0029B79CEF|nr:TadE family protein [Stutzerimonas xanthomarina]MDX2351027.1 pilus assembly protein [Stutzerimonas xanthomarina]
MNAKRMRGVYVVEFAIVSLLLFILMFGVLEMGRLFFTVNALNETVRRGARLAAVCEINEPRILRRAIFNAAEQAGASSLIANLETADLTLVYLDATGAVIATPAAAGAATGFSAIRYVQLRVDNFSFDLLIPGMRGVFTLQPFTSTLPRESLGRHAESDVVPEITPC